MVKTPRVALLIETARGYGRELLHGIVRYARLHGPWSFYITPGDFEQALPKMKQWGGTGVIARIETPKIADALCKLNLPAIALDLSAEDYPKLAKSSRISEVHPDPVAAAKMAANHLLERSFTQFGYVGFERRIWSQQRCDAFVDRIRREGHCCAVYRSPSRSRDAEWSREQKHLSQWLASLPKPIGLFCCNDDRGRQVLEAAMAKGIKVPDEVAVIGMDNDDLLCELCDPPLSSVALNASRGGYEAAKLLDGLMSRRIRKPRQILVEPLWVARRQSTDVLAIDDAEVVEALRYIRENSGQPIQVEDVIGAQQISRRSLEIRFRKAIGRSIHEEIQLSRLERAKQLLAETDWSNDRIAAAAGFTCGSYMGQVLRKCIGMTPAQYRTHMRTR